MKRIEVMLLVVILVGVSSLMCGCSVAQPKTQEPTLRSQTMALNTSVAGYQWAEAFGDSVDTAQSFNLSLLNAEFASLKKSIEELEKKETSKPVE